MKSRKGKTQKVTKSKQEKNKKSLSIEEINKSLPVFSKVYPNQEQKNCDTEDPRIYPKRETGVELIMYLTRFDNDKKKDYFYKKTCSLSRRICNIRYQRKGRAQTRP